MQNKILYLHMGVNKTGSSALQSFFAQNTHTLAENKITYLKSDNLSLAKQGKVTAGNGVQLGLYLKGELDDARSAKVLADFEKQLSQCNTNALLSHEGLSFTRKEKTQTVLNLIAKYNFQIQCILYVRAPIDLTISSYSQKVKRGGSTASLSWTLNFGDLHFVKQKVADIVSAVGEDNITLRNYDLVKSNLEEDFIKKVLQLDEKKFVFHNHSVNRSLSYQENEVCRFLNKYFDEKHLYAYASNHLIYSNPNKKTDKIISKEDFNMGGFNLLMQQNKKS